MWWGAPTNSRRCATHGAPRSETLRRPRFVELVGEPGIGKTTILSAFAADIPRRQRVRLRGDLYTRTTPYRGLRSLLQLTAGLPDDGPELDAAVLRARRNRLDPQLRPSSRCSTTSCLCTLAATEATTALGDDARRRALARLCTAVSRARARHRHCSSSRTPTGSTMPPPSGSARSPPHRRTDPGAS